jgi:hypothetical protein
MPNKEIEEFNKKLPDKKSKKSEAELLLGKLLMKKENEFIKKPSEIDDNLSKAGMLLCKLLKEKDQRERPKKPSGKPCYSKTRCKKVSDALYEEILLGKKGVSLRKSLGEEYKSLDIDNLAGSLWSMKKVLCPLVMIQGLVGKSRSSMMKTPIQADRWEEGSETTTGTISIPRKGVLRRACVWLSCREESYACTRKLRFIGNLV